MTAGDVLLLIVRWIHLVSAASWVGGSIFYLLILRPLAGRSLNGAGERNAVIAAEFRGLVDICIVVLIATGAILSLERLTGGVAGVPFAATLGVKALLTLWMFYLAFSMRRRRGRAAPAPSRPAPSRPARFPAIAKFTDRYGLIAVLGVAVFLVSDLLKVLYEMALTGG